MPFQLHTKWVTMANLGMIYSEIVAMLHVSTEQSKCLLYI